jgi:hypothetical protein
VEEPHTLFYKKRQNKSFPNLPKIYDLASSKKEAASKQPTGGANAVNLALPSSQKNRWYYEM